jgi:hypothetical protein
MARSKILQMIERLSEERERLLVREGTHHAGAGDHRRLADIDHSLGVLWDLGGGSLPARPWGWTRTFWIAT